MDNDFSLSNTSSSSLGLKNSGPKIIGSDDSILYNNYIFYIPDLFPLVSTSSIL